MQNVNNNSTTETLGEVIEKLNRLTAGITNITLPPGDTHQAINGAIVNYLYSIGLHCGSWFVKWQWIQGHKYGFLNDVLKYDIEKTEHKNRVHVQKWKVHKVIFRPVMPFDYSRPFAEYLNAIYVRDLENKREIQVKAIEETRKRLTAYEAELNNINNKLITEANETRANSEQ